MQLAHEACTQNIVCINSFLGKFDYNNIAGPHTEAPYPFAFLGHTNVTQMYTTNYRCTIYLKLLRNIRESYATQ